MANHSSTSLSASYGGGHQVGISFQGTYKVVLGIFLTGNTFFWLALFSIHYTAAEKYGIHI
jgi:hypothetical protein